MSIQQLKGRTIKNVNWKLDGGGYQQLVIELDDGRTVHAYENGQAGEMLLHIDGAPVEPDDDFFPVKFR